MSNELKIKRLARKDYNITDGKNFIYFNNVSSLLARVPEFSQDATPEYSFVNLNKKNEFSVKAPNKRLAVVELFTLLRDSNLMKRFNGTIFQMI
jgi:hypothetical protein